MSIQPQSAGAQSFSTSLDDAYERIRAWYQINDQEVLSRENLDADYARRSAELIRNLPPAGTSVT
jgi:hypothetical protein